MTVNGRLVLSFRGQGGEGTGRDGLTSRPVGILDLPARRNAVVLASL